MKYYIHVIYGCVKIFSEKSIDQNTKKNGHQRVRHKMPPPKMLNYIVLKACSVASSATLFAYSRDYAGKRYNYFEPCDEIFAFKCSLYLFAGAAYYFTHVRPVMLVCSSL